MLAYEGVLLTLAGAQEIANATVTEISFDTEVHDTGDYHNDVTPTEIVIPTSLGGTYYLYASIQWADNGTGNRWIQILVDGTSIARTKQPTIGGFSLTQYVGTSYVLAEGAIVTLEVYQNSTVALDAEQDDYTPRFGADLMGK
jgi:hypothetical protein